MHAGQPAEPLDEVALIFDGCQQGEVVLFSQYEVLGPTAGRDVDDAGPFGLPHFIP